MIIIRALATALGIAAIILQCSLLGGPLAGQPGLPWCPERTPVEIVGGYSLGRACLYGDLMLYEPPNHPKDHWGEGCVLVFRPVVVNIGWDEDFILVERYTLLDDLPFEVSKSHPVRYILVVSTGEVRYATSHDEFLHLRKEMGVPDAIEMRDAREVYYGD